MLASDHLIELPRLKKLNPNLWARYYGRAGCVYAGCNRKLTYFMVYSVNGIKHIRIDILLPTIILFTEIPGRKSVHHDVIRTIYIMYCTV